MQNIYRSADVQKQRDENPPDSEEAHKTWDCSEFVHHANVLPPARLIISLIFRVPKNTIKATITEQSTPSTFITNNQEGAGME